MYKLSILPEEGDDFPYFVFHPAEVEPSTYEWLHVIYDYEDIPSPMFVDDALLEELPQITKMAHTLELEPPIVFLADLEEKGGHLGRFMDGTENAIPIIAIDPSPTINMMPRTIADYLRHTILHELGHAYLRSIGIEYEDGEEEVVETFALNYDPSFLYEYQEGREP